MTTPMKKTVLVLFVGESSEHDVSIMSAQNIQAALDADMITPLFCYIDASGVWWQADTTTKPKHLDEMVTPILGKSAVQIGKHTTHIDVIFPILHGTHGEDGTIQGLAALLHTPIVGCGLDGSLICFDKILTKQLLQAAGIPIVPYKTYHTGEALPDFDALAQHLGPVLFIKPARQGSSVGAGKARTQLELDTAIKEALRYDTSVLIETAIEQPRELEIAALGTSQHPRVSVVGEILPDRDFYSFESKYSDDSTSQIIIPAKIDPDVSARLQTLATQAYGLLRCQGLARIDFFIDAKGAIFLNEVNTLPGFTNISMYPKLWEASGMSYKELIRTLIYGAM